MSNRKKFWYLLVACSAAMTMIIATGGCRRNDSRPFTRNSSRPTYTGPMSVASPTPVVQQTTTGRTLLVPQQYATVKDASLAALPGDVVELAAGTHAIDETVTWSGFTIRGQGAERTEVMAYMTSSPVFQPGDDSSILDLTIREGSWNGVTAAIKCSYARNVVISGVNIQGNFSGIILNDSRYITISNVISRAWAGGVLMYHCNNVSIWRNSFVEGADVIQCTDSFHVNLEENIIVGFFGIGVRFDDTSNPTFRTIRNNVWSTRATHFYWNSSANNYSTLKRGTDISENPLMVNSNWGDIRLSPTSPCATAGTGGGRIGSTRHPYAPAYKTDLNATLDRSPFGTIAPSTNAEILDLLLVADPLGPVTVQNLVIQLITTTGGSIVQSGIMTLIDLDTGLTLGTMTCYPFQTVGWMSPNQPMLVGAGTIKRLALQIDSDMMPAGTPFRATVKSIIWSDGRLSYINDGRIPEIAGNVVQF